MIGAGTMAAAHSIALANVAQLYPELTIWPRLTAVADVNPTLATGLAERFGYERVETDWRSLVAAGDIDLVVVCLPPIFNREVVLAVAAAGKHVVCEKPLGASADIAAEMLEACQTAGVFHGLAAGYRWSPAVRAIAKLVRDGELGTIRSLRAAFMLDYAADPEVPLLWRFRRDLAGGGIAIDTGYHLVDCARFIVGEIETVQAFVTTSSPTARGRASTRSATAAARRVAARRPNPDRSTSRTRPPLWSPSKAGRTASSRPAAWRSGSACRSSSRSTDRLARPSGIWSGPTSSACACPATRRRSDSGGSSSTRATRAPASC
jgi:predicted dehydrogenase